MKNVIKANEPGLRGAALCAVIIMSAIVFPLKANGAAARENGEDFRNVAGKEWMLFEVRTGGKTISIDRMKLETGNMGGAFTISFREGESPNEGQAGGMGVPNRFFAPYTAGSRKTLSIGNIASTMMFAFMEPEELKEREYFDYLAKTTRWDLRKEKLELHSSNINGAEVILVFALLPGSR